VLKPGGLGSTPASNALFIAALRASAFSMMSHMFIGFSKKKMAKRRRPRSAGLRPPDQESDLLEPAPIFASCSNASDQFETIHPLRKFTSPSRSRRQHSACFRSRWNDFANESAEIEVTAPKTRITSVVTRASGPLHGRCDEGTQIFKSIAFRRAGGRCQLRASSAKATQNLHD